MINYQQLHVYANAVWKQTKSISNNHSGVTRSHEFKHLNTDVHLTLTVKSSHMAQTQAMTSAASYFRMKRRGGVRKPARQARHGKEKTNKRMGETIPPFSPPSIISFPSPLSPLTRDSFLLSSVSPPLCFSPSPETKHTPDRLPWKHLTHTPSLSLSLRRTLSLYLAAVTPASSLSSISIPLASRQQGRQLP